MINRIKNILDKLMIEGNLNNMLQKYLIFLLFFFSPVLYSCSRSKKDLVGNWNCESLDSDSGIGYAYTMTFTDDNRWIPNDSEDFSVEYQIKDGEIVYISPMGITVHSDFRIFNNELTISILGIQSRCIKKLALNPRNRR